MVTGRGSRAPRTWRIARDRDPRFRDPYKSGGVTGVAGPVEVHALLADARNHGNHVVLVDPRPGRTTRPWLRRAPDPVVALVRPITLAEIGDPVLMHDPTRVTDGTETHPDDEIMNVRRGAYLASAAERTGGWQRSATPVRPVPDQEVRNFSRSALMTSAWVVGIPCGKPG